MALDFSEGDNKYFFIQDREEESPAMTSPKRHKGSSWFIWDPCGIACAVATYIFLVYGVVVLLAVVAPAFPDVFTFLSTLAFTGLVTLSVVSHVKAMITNPGVVPHESTTEEEISKRRSEGEEVRYCKKCRSVKPDRAHHCSICEHCIHRMDHHCPWINNCVGQNNQKFFVLFTFYVMITSIFGLFLTASFIFRCVQNNFEGCDAFLPGPLVFIAIIFCVFEGFLFSLFTCIMFCTQIHAIITDETAYTETYK
ncbi:PREDICTED: palmitoyltransferase ZDHHC3-like isoform X2 [Amphimedon queenslandica]|uniref:Palmitoyltransferase n=1 Tax=Amphimedon queenslandica TaxID=400682 RepID=A0AAN0J0W3_AMPQE|nr:PREDICTED: palmitoyltransferase ZDHHC3-like isoform X2 [Amphimedon queenslandica]|eukprot:XP_019850679.1 PREDICTED: palmitoyltransferase ZDHHC3-like isoform X2 [Amphimedon queenslandica]